MRLPRRPRPARRRMLRGVGATLCLGTLLLGAGASAAVAAEGPGYGGTARDLTVTWTKGDSPATSAAALPAGRGAGVRAEAPASSPADWALSVQGLGFRANSLVDIRVGATDPFVARADTAGALSIAVPADLTGEALPGVSVVAAGRNPAGTAITMVGSVPPVPAGSGPISLVVWAVAAFFAVWGARLVVGRLRSPTREPS